MYHQLTKNYPYTKQIIEKIIISLEREGRIKYEILCFLKVREGIIILYFTAREKMIIISSVVITK